MGYMELIQQLIDDPSELYWNVDSEARDQMIRLVETDAEKRYFVLRLLAWTRDGVVEAALRRWQQAPPDSDTDFASRIEEAVEAAGWELTEGAGPRFLYPSECYRLDRKDDALASDIPGPVDVITPHEEKCRWCGQQLVNLFDLDLQDPRLTFLAPGWSRLRIAMCGRCTCFTTLYSEVDPQGSSHWSELNEHPGFIGDEGQGYDFPPRRLVLGPQRRTPLEARVATNSRSQIGGFPEWEQGGYSHPECPKCGRHMLFVGQLATAEAFGEPAEGVTYAFLCQECRMAASLYEQT